MKKETVRLTTAQAIIKFLDHQYVELDGKETKFVNGVFGIFGHGCVTGIGEALEHMEHKLTFYQGKNEQSMGLAAMAYAKQKKRREIIPCVSSIGPGATNMVTAAACATANRIPFLALPGDTFATRQPDPVLQQTEIFNSIGTTVNDSFRAVCRYFDRLNRPEQAMSALIQAMRVLTDPADTGAVCLAMPQDVEAEAYDYPVSFFRKRIWHLDRRPLTDAQAARFLKRLRSAKKPMLILGGGVRYAEAGEAFVKFAERAGIPYGETQAGKGTTPQDHPLNFGGIGVTGTLAANELAKEADLIIGAGTRFSDFTTSSKWLFQNPEAKFISLNICPFDAFKLDAEGIIADAREAFLKLTAELGDYRADYTTEELKARKDAWIRIRDEHYRETIEGGFPQTRAVGIINAFAEDDDVVVCAAGSLPGDLQRLWIPGGPDSYHVEYGYSNMGYDLNGALGVKMAQPDSEVFAMVGDGGYLMLNAEVHTMVQERTKVHIMLFDNHGWGCIEDLQNSKGGNSYGTVFNQRSADGMLKGEPIPVDFAMNARSLGAKAYTCTTPEELEAALKDSKKYTDVPVLFDIKVTPKTMSPGYGSWWRVGVAEVSESEEVLKAYAADQEELRKARVF